LNLIELHKSQKLQQNYNKFAKYSLCMTFVYFFILAVYEFGFKNRISFSITNKTYKTLTKSQNKASDILAEMIEVSQPTYLINAKYATFSKKHQDLFDVAGYYLKDNEKITFKSNKIKCRAELCTIPEDFIVEGKNIKYNAQDVKFNMETKECFTKKKSYGEYNTLKFFCNQFDCVAGGDIFILTENAKITVNDTDGKREIQADKITIDKAKNHIILEESVKNTISNKEENYTITSDYAKVKWLQSNTKKGKKQDPEIQLIKFKNNVVLTNKEGIVKSDELYYNDIEKYLFCQKNIKITKQDGSFLTAEFFLFNKETENAKFFDNLDVALKDEDFLRVIKVFKINIDRSLERKPKQGRSKIVIF
jgi:hypothetical protein